MMKSRLVLLSLLAALSLPATLAAQEPPRAQPGRWYGGINFILAQPEGEFREHVERGFGGGGNLIYQLDRTGLLGLRVDLGFVNYGRETHRVPFSSTVGGRVTVDVETTNNILAFGVGPQLMLPDGRLRPYLHGILGASYFFTESRVQGTRNDERIAQTTNHDDLTFSYGGGAGLYVPVHRGATVVSIDLGARYLVNGQARYLREGSIRDEPGGAISFTPIQSETNFFTFHLGLAVRPGQSRAAPVRTVR